MNYRQLNPDTLCAVMTEMLPKRMREEGIRVVYASIEGGMYGVKKIPTVWERDSHVFFASSVEDAIKKVATWYKERLT